MECGVQENQMRHILVVTPLVGFGDGVQMIPFFQALHGAFPDRQVTWVVGFNRDFTCHLKTLCPFIHRIIHLQFKSPRFSMLWKFDLARYGLTDVAYEYIFDFHYKWPVSLLLKHRLLTLLY
jgi:ADP-heptose:LPS heptosyltransferase